MNKRKRTDPNAGDGHLNNQFSTQHQAEHPFSQLFSLVDDLPTTVREEITKVCSWSIPTFYRKLRNSGGFPDRTRRGVSYAHMLAIIEVYINNIQRIQTAFADIKASVLKIKKP